ncbi:MAG: DUF4153 domain-containing protein [Daejeonella sp.]
MKRLSLQSVKHLLESASKVIARFPLETLCALLATVVGCHMVSNGYSHSHYDILSIETRLLMVSNLGLVLFLSVSLFAESKGWNVYKKLAARLGVLLILISLFFTLSPYEYESDILKFFLLSAVFHLMVSFAPFTGKDRIEGFWQYNKILFLRILSAGLYSGVLYAGLAVALLSIEHLFGINVDGKLYSYLGIIIICLFNTLFFLAGVPHLSDELETVHNYPKALKIFTQYVLIPLVTIYSIILLLYSVKIGFQWHLPKGWVSVLILAYSVLGIFSLLLIHPIRSNPENKWMRFFSRYFYIALVPLLVLFWLAIYKRVNDYGVTEERYILIVAAIWLSFISIWNLVTSGNNIKVIPISLAVIFALTIFGPQSAFNISKISQVNRLKKLIKEGKRDEVYDIVSYLGKKHGVSSLQPFVKTDIEKLKLQFKNEPDSSYYKTEEARVNDEVLDTLKKLITVKGKSINKKYDYHTFTAEYENMIAEEPSEYVINDLSRNINFIYEPLHLTVNPYSNGERETEETKILRDEFIFIKIENDSLQIDLKEFTKGLLKKHAKKQEEIILPRNQMRVERTLKEWDIVILFDQISFGENINYYDFTLLLNKKK